MSEHFRTICKSCGKIINQCRCMSENKTVYYDVCDSCKLQENDEENTEQGNNVDQELTPDGEHNNTPVFDVDQSTFYKNMRQDRNRMRFPNGHKASQFMKSTSYRQPFYMRTQDKAGQQYLKKVK